MGLDSYSKKRLEEVKEDSNYIQEIQGMESFFKLDSDLQSRVREAAKEIEMEKVRLERQNEQEKIEYELNRSKVNALDSMPYSFTSSNYSSTNQNKQEENQATYGQSLEEVKRNIDETARKGLDIIAQLEASIYQDEQIEEEQSTRHR